MNPRRLYRSRDRQLAGVAGGMAEYLDIDPTVVRILWIIVGVASGGLALVAYFILALVMPQAPYATAPGAWSPPPGATGSTAWGTAPAAPAWGAAPAGGWNPGPYPAPQVQPRAEGRGIGAAAIVGVVLIVFGAIALADAALPGWAAGAIMGPAVILALGAALLASSLRRRPAEAAQTSAAAPGATDTMSTAGPATLAYSTPSVPGMPEAPTAPWDATDTQTVDAIRPEAGDQGSRPA